MVEEDNEELTSPMKVSKVHLHVERFSLKTSWRLAEGLVCTQGCDRKSHMESSRKEGGVISMGPAPLRRDTGEEGDVTSWEIP